MKTNTLPDCRPKASNAARARLLSSRFEPLFLAGWHRVLMIHFEVDPADLQRDVPFQLDLYEGRAFLSLVAFTMQGMRPRIGGPLAVLLFKPIATHSFLNVRTYVRHNGECGIHFLAEWLGSRLAAGLGPPVFGLPYRYGRLHYQHDERNLRINDVVRDLKSRDALRYHGALCDTPYQCCEAGTIEEWLMERYTAFNAACGMKRLFRIWHPSWPQSRANIELEDLSLVTHRWPWFKNARLVGANYSPGFDDVWMSRPHFA